VPGTVKRKTTRNSPAPRGPEAQRSISVRMYNVGFGDAFLVTVPAAGRVCRVLFDCGSIAAAPGRAMSDVVPRIIADATDPDGVPRIDVVVATHRHRDHVSGFDLAAWAKVEVREVWMPWTEDPTDPAAREIREIQSKLALALQARLAESADPDFRLLVENALTNEKAMKTLHSGFAVDPKRRFLPAADAREWTFTTDALPGVTVHVLGPSRDKEVIRDMTPPKAESYLRLRAAPIDVATGKARAPFPSHFETASPPRGVEFGDAERAKLRDAAAFADLDAAVALDQAVNGTSLMLVLAVAGTHLLFPGDAQWGTWAAAMKNPAWADLLRSVRFYKVGHHGSENATPRQFVEKLLPDAPWAMVSTIERPQWKNLPKPGLLEALSDEKHAILVRSDKDAAAATGPRGYRIEHDVVVEAEIPLV